MTSRIVKIILRGDVSDFVGKMKATSSAARSTVGSMTDGSKEAKRYRAELSSLGATAGKIGLVAAGGVALITKAAMDWESAWTGVLKTVDGTPAQLKELEQGLLDLATQTGFASSEVAGIAEAAGQLGISTAGVEDFTRTMLDMGVSTNLSAGEAATGLARLRNIMGTSEPEIRNTGSAMVELGNNFATTEPEILAMSLRIAGAGRQAGLTTSDVLGLSTAMSSVGIEAEAGGTAVSLTLKRIGRAVDEGGDSLDLFATTAGLSMAEFQQAWGEDAAGTFTKFVAGLERAKEAGQSTTAVLDELGITGIRESDALLRISGNAEGLARALDSANDGFAENQALTDESTKFYETSAQEVKKAWESIKVAAVEAGGVMLPIISETAQGVGAMARAFSKLPAPVTAGVTAMLGITAVLGGGLWFTAKAISGVATMRTNLATLGPAGAKAGAGLMAASRGVAQLAVAYGGLKAADAASKIGAEDVRELSDSLEILARTGRATGDLGKLFGEDLGGKARAFRKDLGGIGDTLQSFQGYADDSVLTNFVKDIGSATNTIGIRRQADAIADIDAALSRLNTNDPEQAAKAFSILSDEAERTGASAADIEAAFPLMSAAIAAGGDAAGDAAGEFDGMGGAAEDAQAAVDDLKDALDLMLDPFLNQEDASNAWKESLLSLTADLKENGATLSDNTVKGLANQDAIRDRVKALKDSAQADLDAGGSQEEFSGKLIRGAEHIIDAARAAGIGEDAVRDYTAQLGLTPEQVNTLIAANDKASSKLSSVHRSIRALDGAGATVHVNVLGGALRTLAGIGDKIRALPGYVERANGGAIGRAGGGSVIGAGTATSDSIPAIGPGGVNYRLSNGEHILDARDVQLMGGQDAVYAMRAALNGQRAGMATTQQYAMAGGGNSGSNTMSMSLVGAQVAIDPHTNIATFVRGEIRAEADYNASQRRANR